MNAPRYGYQPYQAPREGIAITTRFSPLMWLFATVTPKIFVNGYQMRLGASRVSSHAGSVPGARAHPVFLSAAGRSGGLRRDRLPGQFIELEYKAPLFTCSRGSLGPPPQRYNGMAVIIGVMAAAVLLIFAMAAIVAVAA
jgi:hypothetical protein